MFKLFKKKEAQEPTNEQIIAPLTGKVVPLSEVPDPVFSQKMMGDGIAIIPTEGTLVSPVEGTIIQVFPTKHAVGIKSKIGAEVLIHVGLETVNMKGEGFQSFVAEGDKVSVGDKLLTFDLGLIEEKASSTVTPIIVTNAQEAELTISNQVEQVDVVIGSDVVFELEK